MSDRRRLTTLAGVAVGALLLAVVLAGVEWHRVGDVLAASDPLYLVPIAAAMAVHYLLKGLRWRALLSGSGDVSRSLSVRLTLLGFLFNNIFPFRTGELGRPYLLSVHVPGVRFSFALATVVGDKLFDLLFVILSLLAASLLVPMPDWVAAGIGVLAGVTLAFLAAGLVGAAWQKRGGETDQRLVRLARRLGRHGPALLEALRHFLAGLGTLTSPRRAAAAFGWALLSFGCLAAAVHWTLAMLSLPADPGTVLFVLGVTGVGFMIPAPPTNAGNFHFFASRALLMLHAAGADAAFSFAFISHISQVLVVTLMGAACLHGLDWRAAARLGKSA